MRQIIRSFSIGLFAAGIIMLAVYFMSDASNSAENMELEELIPLVEEKGHRVVTEEDYIALSVQSSEEEKEETNKAAKEEKEENEEKKSRADEESASDDEENEEKDTNQEENADEDEKEKEEDSNKPANYTINIQSGMSSQEIGSLLEENDIIDDASDFTDYLEEHDFSIRLKAGEHELSSDMSFYELAMELISP